MNEQSGNLMDLITPNEIQAFAEVHDASAGDDAMFRSILADMGYAYDAPLRTALGDFFEKSAALTDEERATMEDRYPLQLLCLHFAATRFLHSAVVMWSMEGNFPRLHSSFSQSIDTRFPAWVTWLKKWDSAGTENFPTYH